MNEYSITQDSSQILNAFNNNNNLFDVLDFYNPQSENKEDFSLFSFYSESHNSIDNPFKSKLSINNINENYTIFNNSIDLFEE